MLLEGLLGSGAAATEARRAFDDLGFMTMGPGLLALQAAATPVGVQVAEAMLKHRDEAAWRALADCEALRAAPPAALMASLDIHFEAVTALDEAERLVVEAREEQKTSQAALREALSDAFSQLENAIQCQLKPGGQLPGARDI